MNRPSVDYSGFRLSRVREPQFRHVLLLSTWLVYFALYVLTENLIPEEKCHVMHCAVDDMIPFNEYFLVFYVGWYLLVAGSLGYYFFYDVKRFRELDLYIFVTQMVAMALYIFFPSRQDLRPAAFPRENFFTWVLGIIYAVDTDTGVCPSLHVAYSLAIFNVIVKDGKIPAWVKWLVGIFAGCVCASTMFVKQHSFLDFLAALPVVLLGECLIYGKSYWLPKFKKQRV